MATAPKFLTNALRALGVYHPLRDLRRDLQFRRRMKREMTDWRRDGCPAPPPAVVKHDRIRSCARRFDTPVLVETGTFHGDTLFAMRHQFRTLHSIELAEDLHAIACRAFAHLPQIHLHHGDSAVVLPQVASSLEAPALFWLDGHFCAGPSARGDRDTPIGAELDFLLARPPARHVVLIDDARLFTGRDDYPTLEMVRTRVARARPQASCEVIDDIIVITPV